MRLRTCIQNSETQQRSEVNKPIERRIHKHYFIISKIHSLWLVGPNIQAITLLQGCGAVPQLSLAEQKKRREKEKKKNPSCPQPKIQHV